MVSVGGAQRKPKVHIFGCVSLSLGEEWEIKSDNLTGTAGTRVTRVRKRNGHLAWRSLDWQAMHNSTKRAGRG